MAPSRGALVALLVALCVPAALPSPASAVWSHDPSLNNALAQYSTSNQRNIRVCRDGVGGGAYVAWEDNRNGNYDIYAIRIDAYGATRTGWPSGGLRLTNTAQDELLTDAYADAGTDLRVAFERVYGPSDHDPVVLKINGDGTYPAGWAVNGVNLAPISSDQRSPMLTIEGSGGILVTWQDNRSIGVTGWDIYAQKVTSAGAVSWTANGVVICDATGNQSEPKIVADISNGANIVWEDERNIGGTGRDIYAQHVYSNGSVASPADGWVVCDQANDQVSPQAIPDGLGGGMICVWYDFRSGSNWDLYAQRYFGNFDQAWTTDGVPVCTDASSQMVFAIALGTTGRTLTAWADTRSGHFDVYIQILDESGQRLLTAAGYRMSYGGEDALYPAITSDGAGGAYLAWQDFRGGVAYDIYAGRYNAEAGGRIFYDLPVTVAVGNQSAPRLIRDAGGGAIVAWTDGRSWYGDTDIFAQRVDPWGELGHNEPGLVSVRDVPNDQGGRLAVRWSPSPLDKLLSSSGDYTVWRQVPIAAALRQVAAGAALRVTRGDGVEYYWEAVGSVTATGLEGYSMVIPTECDSVGPGIGNRRTVVMVDYLEHYFTAPDSGYSVDNLAPLMPQPFTGTYAGGGSVLHWGANREADLAGYRLYRGKTPDFACDAGHFVADVEDTSYTDPAGEPYYYKLGAVDVHGNVSPFAFAQPAGTVDAPITDVPRELWLGRAAPNPARAAATIRFGLPQEGEVALAVYDQAGRRVREVARGRMAAGEHVARVEGTGLPPGLYFYRLEAAGRTLTGRMVFIR